MKQINVLFFGTHEFGKTILTGLHGSPHINVHGVVTQPDRPVGRKQELTPSPVKQYAISVDLPLFQPTSLKSFDVNEHPADLYIVAQYGLLVPEQVLQAPEFGTINVHTSLLPKYRGASPIQSAILNGETETGVTIMLMDKGLDTGPILSQTTLPIKPDDTYLDLDKKMAAEAIPLLLDTAQSYISGDIKPKKQNNAEATTCTKLSRADGEVDWNQTAQVIYNRYRAFTPWPGIWTTIEEKRFKLLSINPSPLDVAPGMMQYKNDTIYIGTSDASVEIIELQLEGKQAMDAKTFIQGYAKFNNSILGPSRGSST